MGVVSVVENTNLSTSASHKEHSVVVEIERFYEGTVMDNVFESHRFVQTVNSYELLFLP
jgi:hypothetical protein